MVVRITKCDMEKEKMRKGEDEMFRGRNVQRYLQETETSTIWCWVNADMNVNNSPSDSK